MYFFIFYDKIILMKDEIINKFFELLNDMKYEDISVSLLCEKCNISRTTFYKHFKNLDDVFYEVENKVLNDMERIYIENNTPNKKELNSETELSNLYEMYKYIYDHKKLFVFFYSDNCPKTYMDKAIKEIMNRLNKSFNRYMDKDQAKKASSICTNFIIATTKTLVTDEYSLNPKQLSILFRNLTLHLINNKETYF